VPTGDGITETVTVRVNKSIIPWTSQAFARVQVEMLQ
jgi:hypothetical protein